MRAITLIWIVFLTACTPRAVREAESVVAQADSLRAEGRMYGIDEGDSATLAQAYETLKKYSEVSRQFSEICPFIPCTSSLCTYAHACYHYGRLLREKDNPVEAMQVFINATHSHTRDNYILGRVYSNMGSICHLAGDYPLSYEMYERSADCFLESGDTMSYYYDVNRMAFEKADLADSAACLLLIQKLKDIPNIYELTSITKAELFTKIQRYDSAIYYANILIDSALYTPTCALIKANAFSYLGQNDSALAYANMVIADTLASYQNKFNALYFISHLDSALSVEEIQSLASLREDIRYYEYEPDKEKLTQAVQLLEQDLNRKPDWRWLYALIAFILFAGSLAILYYIWRKRKQHRELIKDLHEKEEEQSHLENTLNNLSQLQETRHAQILKEAEEVCLLIGNSTDIRAELCWNNYEQMCTTVNLRLFGIIDRLQSFSLSEKEMRLCVLILLQVSTEQMVDMIPYARSGIGKFKYTTARKLGTTTSVMRSFILNLMG